MYEMKVKLYKVVAVTPKGPANMSDDIARRIDCKVLLYTVAEGEGLLWKYVEDADGNTREGWLRTSIVKKIQRAKNSIEVETMNTFYKFELYT